MTSLLFRRIVAKLRPLADLLDLELDLASESDDLVRSIEAIAERAIDVALHDEQQLAASLAIAADRFDKAWPDFNKVDHLLGSINAQMFRVRQAIEDAAKRPDLKPQVVVEIGEAMILLSRLALAFGASTPMQPMQLGASKFVARVHRFGVLLTWNGPPDSRSRSEIWDMAAKVT
jgi:hypothetical protein